MSIDFFIGIDQSLSNTGICILSKEGWYDFRTITPKKIKGIERLDFIITELINILNAKIYVNANVLIGLEDYAYAGSMKGFVLGELGGLIKYSLFKNNKPFVIVPIGIWKKELIGKGNANKNEIRTFFTNKFINDGRLTQDEIDAYCIAEYLRRKNGRIN
jgi:Holliday junction resolvasome RuvABC endonuclease subunit